MSWLRWQGETWPVTDDEAELRVFVRAPNVPCPRQIWSMEVAHYLQAENPATHKMEIAYSVDAEISDLYFYEKDWRRLSNLTIYADTKWHDAHEHVSEYGRHQASEVNAMTNRLAWAPPAFKLDTGRVTWLAHDFVLRLGTRDGFCFPCELDAWMIPNEEYYRAKPETAAEVARFPQTPPNLQIITRACFTGGTLDVPRCKDDPIPVARRILRDEIGLEEILNPKVHWMLRHTADHKKIVSMPGFRSTVSFWTE